MLFAVNAIRVKHQNKMDLVKEDLVDLPHHTTVVVEMLVVQCVWAEEVVVLVVAEQIVHVHIDG